MLIAIDYDETWSRDPDFWRHIVAAAKLCGHTLIGVTMRDAGDHNDMCRHYQTLPVYFTGGKAKRKFMADKGIMVDVWIDDSPEFIGNAMVLDFDDVPEPGRSW